MKISKNTAFKPVTITLESKDELICMRAVVDAIRFRRPVSERFISNRDQAPFVGDVEAFAAALDRELADEKYN